MNRQENNGESLPLLSHSRMKAKQNSVTTSKSLVYLTVVVFIGLLLFFWSLDLYEKGLDHQKPGAIPDTTADTPMKAKGGGREGGPIAEGETGSDFIAATVYFDEKIWADLGALHAKQMQQQPDMSLSEQEALKHAQRGAAAKIHYHRQPEFGSKGKSDLHQLRDSLQGTLGISTGLASALYQDNESVCENVGQFNETCHTIRADKGWNKLHVVTHTTLPDPRRHNLPAFTFGKEDALYAAGYCEGRLTALRIHDNYMNVHQQWAWAFFSKFVDVGFKQPIFPTHIAEWLVEHMDWLITTAATERSRLIVSDEDRKRWIFWDYVRLLLAQFEGLVMGYQSSCTPKPNCLLSRTELLLLQLDGDLITLIPALNEEAKHMHEQKVKNHQRVYGDPSNQSPYAKWYEDTMAERATSAATTPALGTLFTSFKDYIYRTKTAEGSKAVESDEKQAAVDEEHSKEEEEEGGAEPPMDRQHDLEMLRAQRKDFRCSGLIRLTTDHKDLLMAHDTWDGYGSMTRIFKHYDFSQSSDPLTPLAALIFSSSPGYLMSVDDFYISSNRLVVLETTNEFFDTRLYSTIKPQCVLSFMRSMVAMYSASSGPQWVDAFSRYNSGTYNDQWMIVDLKKFSPPHEDKKKDEDEKEDKKKDKRGKVEAGLLWVLEQMPQRIVAKDMTDVLVQQSYWASYNVPYFKTVYQDAGYPRMLRKYGPLDFSHEFCGRAQIFRRDAPKVESLADMQQLMTSNDFTHDPLSYGDPRYAIMSRFDLFADPAKRLAMGGIDSKITSWALAYNMTALAMNGPTHQSVKEYRWSDNPVWEKEQSHAGQPNSFHFPFETMNLRQDFHDYVSGMKRIHGGVRKSEVVVEHISNDSDETSGGPGGQGNSSSSSSSGHSKSSMKAHFSN